MASSYHAIMTAQVCTYIMSAGNYNIICEQGATFGRVITWEDENDAPINLTGYTADMQVRDISDNLIVELSTTNSRIALGGSAGTITLSIDATTTASLTSGEYDYDLFLTSSGGQATRLLAGDFRVVERITE